ncbi:MAG: hypothetical protein HOY78_30780 [Saccharothrix sp.]|nr:hypothetical protein [Saccharothrix sp.]
MSVEERADSRWLRRFITFDVERRISEDGIRLGLWGAPSSGKTTLLAALAEGIPAIVWDRRPGRLWRGMPDRRDRQALARLLQRITDLRRRVEARLSRSPVLALRTTEPPVRVTRPPGRTVAAHRHVTRGPDVPRTTPVMVVRG